MGAAAPLLRVIEGGGEPRPAVAAPDLSGVLAAERIPLRPGGLSSFHILAAVALSLAVHAGVIWWGMQHRADDEARAAGGASDPIVTPGESVIMVDSLPSDPSDGIPEAQAIGETAAAVAVAPDEVAEVSADAAPQPVADTATAVADDTAVKAAEPAPTQLAQDAATTAQVSAPAEIAEDATATASPDTATPAVDDAVVAALEEAPPEPPVTTPAAAKPAPKPPAKPKPTPRSEQRAASVANEAARGPAPGKAGAGGTSTEERGRADTSAYQAKLAAHLRRFRTFPPEARDKGITGTAIVRFTVTGSGAVSAASLAKSSGAGVLDQAAVAMVRRASPFPPIPSGMGASLTVNVPVRFDMR
jgi:protein TonB